MFKYFRNDLSGNLPPLLKPGLLIAVLIFGSTAFPAMSAAENLTSALISAYRSSPELKAQRASLRGSDEDVAKAWAARRPTLSAQASAGVSHLFAFNSDMQFATLNLAASQTLWDGGMTDLAIRSAKAGVKVGRATLI